MKKLLFIALIALCIDAKAQITLEHVYDSASTYLSGTPAVEGQLMIINFEISGERYVKINRWGKVINIYDMSHSLVKTISLASLPLWGSSPNGTIGSILYLSEQLFDTDSKIEFLYTIDSPYTGIYNEDGTLLFSDTGSVPIRMNIPEQQYPIYNTSVGTKMILSYNNNNSGMPMPAKVFSLPGILSTDIAKANSVLVAQSSISNPYPNPAVNTTQIDYVLPKGINQGEIVFYNLQGKEVKRFKVDNTFNSLLISTSNLAAGTYYYQLQTSGQNSAGKKMVVIK